MALETVDILVESDDVVPEPVDDVTIQVFDSSGTTLLTQGTTGAPAATGHVQFVLDGGDPNTYQLRFSVTGGRISQPQSIEIYSPASASPTGTNNFRVTTTLFSLPVSADPLLCRASGYVVDATGFPRRGVDIYFIPRFNPLVSKGRSVLNERAAVRTDKDGYMSVDLFRNGVYGVVVETQENVRRDVYVPDRSHVNINHLLFPVIRRVEYDPAPPWALVTGQDLVVVPTLTATDFRSFNGSQGDVLYESTDENVFTVKPGRDSITIRAQGTGNALLSVVRSDTSIVYLPDPGIDGNNAQVVVT